MNTPVEPRLLDRDEAARYLACSTDTIDRMRQAGTLQTVRLPATRARRNGHGVAGMCRRILFDRRDCDALIEASKESAE